jgi:hypothetical protein
MREVYHFEQWGRRIAPNFASPMIRADDGQDYYVLEPALAVPPGEDAAMPVLPTRWFMRDGAVWGTIHLLRVGKNSPDAFVVDATRCLDIPLSRFLFALPKFCEIHLGYGLPSPLSIEGVLHHAVGSRSAR